MNSQEAMNLDEYQKQKLTKEFGDAILVSWTKQIDREFLKATLMQLAENLGAFIATQGYQPSAKEKIVIKVPTLKSTADPLNKYSTIAGMVEADFSGTRNQYILYASGVIDALKDECRRQIERDWKERLRDYISDTVAKRSGYESLEDEDIDESPFPTEMDEFIVKTEKTIQEFIDSAKI